VPALRLRQTAAIIAASLILLKLRAFIALFKVVILLDQKLMSRNEVIPISSHPRNRVTQDPESTRSVMDQPNSFKKTKKFTIFFSNLIYEKAYAKTQELIRAVNKAKP
jgi:hypothetical protein